MSRIRVATLSELRERGVIVVSGADRPIAVFAHDDRVSAVDNRCPHIGFPLHTGTLKEGLLTCHWHEARFDICNGCTFDLWADDVASFATVIEEGTVFVDDRPRRQPDESYYRRRLSHGLEHGISLIQAKAILGLRRNQTDWSEIVREIALFGSRRHDNWDQGMTILAVVGNLIPHLGEQTTYHALFRASRQVAINCSNAVSHRPREPLDDADHSPERLKQWMSHWVQCRHRDGAERVLLTAIERFGSSQELTGLVYSAALDRVYSQTGHVFDFTNKAFELLDLVGWEHAGEILPLLLDRMVTARGAEEDAHWHHPIELVEPLREVENELGDLLNEGRNKTWIATNDVLDVLLGDDPQQIIDGLAGWLRLGATPAELARRVAYAAALRLARFAMTNEVADWFGPRHTFIFANAVHQAVKRCETAGTVRGIFQAAFSVYMDRFLNHPAARLPDAAENLDDLPSGADALQQRLLSLLDTQASVTETALTVARYLRLGHPVDGLIDTLTLATVREDFDFHAVQVLEAGVRQYFEWDGKPEGEHILIGVVRQLAAFCPTPRAGHQTATIASRLERGDKIYEEADYQPQ